MQLDYEELLAQNRSLKEENQQLKEELKCRDLIGNRNIPFLEIIPQMVSYTNKDLRYEYVNKAYERNFKVQSSDIVGKPLQEIIGEKVFQKAHKHIMMALSGKVVNYVEKFEYPDNMVKYIEGQLIPEFSDKGIVNGYWAILQDITEKVKAENTLRKQEEILRLTNNNISDIIWQLDADARFIYCSPTVKQMLGFEIDHVIGKHVLEFIDSRDHAIAIKNMKKRYEKEAVDKADAFEYRMIHKNGSIVFTEVLSNAIKDKKGNLLGYSGVTRDITERKKSEKRITESEERFRKLIDAAPMSILLMREGKYIFANPAGMKLLGYKKHEEIVGKDALSTIAPEYHQLIRERMKKIQRGLSNAPVEIELIRPDGNTVWSSTNSVSIEMDNQPTAVIVGHDITDRKKMEGALRESEEKYRTLFNNAPLGIFRSTPEGRFLEMNPSLAELLGYNSPEEAIREIKDIAKQVYVRTNKRFDIVNETVKSNELQQFQNVYKRKNGEHFIANLYLKSFRNESGDVLYLEGMVEDITERIEKEAEIRESETKYRKLMEEAPVGIMLFVNENIEIVNKKLLEILGFGSLEELRKMKIQDLIFPEDQGTMRTRLEAIRNKTIQFPFQSNYRIVHRNGSVHHVVEYATQFTVNEKTYEQSIIQDITETIEAEKSKKKLTNEAVYLERKMNLLKNVESELQKVIMENNYHPDRFSGVLKLFKNEDEFERHWAIFKDNFESLHKGFFEKLSELSPKLTQQDIKHCALIKMNFETKEIAAMFNVKPSSIQMSRVRLKKKLGLTEKDDLIRFILSL